MYKGKFDQKNRQSSANTKDLLAQRERSNAARSAKNASRPSAPGQAPKPRPAGNPQRPVPSAIQNQRRNAPTEPVVVQKSGPRIGGVIFYTLYFMFILAFFAATYLGLNWLNGWLADFEASQPTVKSEQVFQQLFSDPDWGLLYDAAGVEDTPYEGKEEFVTYMDARMGDQKLTYLETSAGLSGDKKFVVHLGKEKVATFTLVNKNKVSDTADELEEITTIADWRLGSVELFFARRGTYRIEKMDDCKALVNGVELSDDFTIQSATTSAESYLPAGTPMPSTSIQEITGLLTTPTVKVLDASGKETEVTYDENTRTFTQRTSSNTINAEQEAAVWGASETYCKWMIKAVTSRNTVAQYYDKTTDAYNSIVRTTELWMQDYSGYEFTDRQLTGFTQYTDNLFSVRSSLNLRISRTDGTVKERDVARSMIFQKDASGKWLCIRATNVDITQPKGKVRLTFMLDGQKLLSSFFDTDADEISTPTVAPVPEGKVFAGWYREETDEDGVTTLSLVFLPDESGKVKLPEGTSLEPMTLIARFENIGAAAPADSTASAEGGES